MPRKELTAEKVKSESPSVDSLAVEIGVATRTLFGWFRRGCPRDSADAVRTWRAANMEPRRLPGIASPLWEQERAARTAKINADADGVELRNAAKRRELYDAAEVKANVAELLAMIRERLATMPDELAAEFPPECQALGRQRVGDRITLLGREIDAWIFDYEPEPIEENEECF